MNEKVDVRSAKYAEIRIQTDLLIEIANTLLKIESHLCGTETTQVTHDLVAKNRELFLSVTKPV